MPNYRCAARTDGFYTLFHPSGAITPKLSAPAFARMCAAIGIGAEQFEDALPAAVLQALENPPVPSAREIEAYRRHAWDTAQRARVLEGYRTAQQEMQNEAAQTPYCLRRYAILEYHRGAGYVTGIGLSLVDNFGILHHLLDENALAEWCQSNDVNQYNFTNFSILLPATQRRIQQGVLPKTQK